MANHILGIILFIAMIFPCLRSWLYNRKKLAYRLFIAFIYANKRSGKLGQPCIYRQVARTNDRCRYDTATTPPLSTRLEMLPKYWVSWIYLLSFSRLWTKNKRLMSHSTRNLLKAKTRCLKEQLKRQPSKTTARNVSDASLPFLFFVVTWHMQSGVLGVCGPVYECVKVEKVVYRIVNMLCV